MQQRLVEAGLVFLRHEQHLVLLRGELLGQLLLADAVVHALFGVGDVGELVVLHRAGERHQRLDGIALLLDVAIEALLVAHGFQARTRDHHRLGPAADLVARDGVEVLDHHLGLLGDVVRVQSHEARQRLRRLLALDVRVVVARLQQLEVGRVGRVVLQHVEDERFLDRLPHGVAVRRLPIAAEDGEGLVLGRRGEGEEAQVRLPAALGHAAEQLLHVLEAFFRRPPLGLLAQPLAAQHLLEIGGGLAALRAVRLVDDHGAAPRRQRAAAACAALLGHLEQLPRDERKLLQRGDDHRHRVLQRLGQLPRALVDLLHHAALVLELVDRVLQLLVEHHPVGHHDHAVEDPLILGVVQRRQSMRQPADGVALAAARRVLDEIVVADALAPGRVHQRAHGLKLVVAREDHRLLLDLAALVVALLLDLEMDEPRQQVEEAVPLQDLLPQIGRAIGAPRRVGRVAGAAVAPFVEGQEVRRRACQPRGHEHRFGVHGEMDQRAPLELEDRLARVAVAACTAGGRLPPSGR